MIRLTRPACPDQAALRSDYRHPPNKNALRLSCSDKCMYCEGKVTQVYWGDVEHIKPKAVFPELTNDWENLGFVCARCNNEKSDKWNNDLPFVNPFEENPDQHLAALGPFVFHRNGSERGEYTWREVGLNRPELIERRNERIKIIRDLFDKAVRTENEQLRGLVLKELQEELADDKEYAMTSRATHEQIQSA